MSLAFLVAPLRSVGAATSALDCLAAPMPVANASLYNDMVAQLRGSVVQMAAFSRHGGAHRSTDRPMGGLLILQPHLRRVSTVVGYRAHVDKAAVLPFPLDARLRSSALPEDLQAAIFRAVSLGDGLIPLRDAVMTRCRALTTFTARATHPTN